MRHIKINGLFEHLVAQGLSRSTAVRYESYAKKAVREGVNPFDDVAVEEWLQKGSASGRRTALNALRSFNDCEPLPAVKKTDGLDDFGSFLRQKRLALMTVKNYRGQIRKLFKDRKDGETLKEVFNRRMERLVEPGNLSAAWTQYQKWLSEVVQEEAPETVEFPVEVKRALSVLHRLLRYRPSQLAELSWFHLQFKYDHDQLVEIRVPDLKSGKPNHYLRLANSGAAIAAFGTLFTWGQPWCDEVPLVPVEPGSFHPAEKKHIAAAIREMKVLQSSNQENSDAPSRRASSGPPGPPPGLPSTGGDTSS